MEPQQNFEQPTPTPQPPAPISQQPVMISRPKSSKLPLFLAVFLLLVALAGCGYLGYLYMATNDKLTSTQQELEITKTALQNELAAKDFIAKHNDANLSRSSCGGSSLLMSDVHVNDKFIVYRYLCSDKSSPVLIGAFAKHKSGPTDFTYGSSPTSPNGLPSYIYDSEPEFFGPVYGTTRL